MIEKEKIAKKKKKITKESAPRFVSAAVRERSRNVTPHKHIILCFFSFQYFFVNKFVPSRERERNQQQQTNKNNSYVVDFLHYNKMKHTQTRKSERVSDFVPLTEKREKTVLCVPLLKN